MATAEEYATWIVQNRDKQGSPEFDTVAKAYQISKLTTPAESPRVQQEQNPILKAGKEFGSAAIHHITGIPFGTGQLFSNAAAEAAGLVAPESGVAKSLQERAKSYGDFMRDREREYQARTPDSPASYAGAAAGEIAPFMLGPVKTGLSALNEGVSGGVGKLAELARINPTIAKYLGQVGGGAIIAPTAASLQPVLDENYGQGKLGQLKNAAAIGAAIPAAGIPLMATAKTVGKLTGGSLDALRETFKNFSPRGQKALAEKHIADLAQEGGKPATDLAVKALETVRGPISNVTVADALAGGNVGAGSRFGGPLVRLQDELARLPETSTQLRSSEVAQEVARKAALSRISGTEAERSVAASNLEKASTAYESIKSALVKSNSTLDKLSRSPAFQAAERRAEEISANANAAARANKERIIPFKKLVKNENGKEIVQYSAQGLQHIKQVLDEMTNNPTLRGQLGITGTEGANITPVKNTLVSWMNRNIEGWQSAREGYKSAKEVLNRQAGGDVLSKVLTGPRGEERAGQFLQAQRDLPKTLKSVTGKERPIPFTPQERAILKNITQELERDAMASRMAAEVNIPGATSPVTGKMAQLPSPLYRPTMIANWILKRGGDEGNKAVNRIAADILMDPSKAAKIIRKFPPDQRSALMSALSDFNKFAKEQASLPARAVIPSVAARKENK